MIERQRFVEGTGQWHESTTQLSNEVEFNDWSSQMPIPPFDGILNVLPPHLGDPRHPAHMSPYPCEIDELCIHFATSQARKVILGGFLDLRKEMLGRGLQGFHWLNGSFCEDIESREGRDPNDIDVVTFVESPADPAALNSLIGADLLSTASVKSKYHVDHYWLPLGSAPINVVEHTRYWFGLFSHRRDRIWKGMLCVPLGPLAKDDEARKLLAGAP